MKEAEDQLLSLVDDLFASRGLKVRVQGIEDLQDEQIYFQLCRVIFPDEVMEGFRYDRAGSTPAKRIDALIEHMERVLNIDLRHISGKNIVNGNPNDMFNLLQFFERINQEFQNMEQTEKDDKFKEQFSRQQQDPLYSDQNEESDQEEQDDQPAQNQPNRANQPKDEDGSAESHQEEQGDLRQEILQQIDDVKKAFKKAAVLDKRKNKNQDITQAKEKYKAYLKDMVKSKVIDKRIAEIRKPKKERKNQTVPYYVRKQEEELNNQQDSLGMRLRDHKTRYLRRVKYIVQGLERKRIAEERRQHNALQKEFENHTRTKIKSLVNQHNRKQEVLREKHAQTREICNRRDRENIKLVAQSQRRLKQYYKEERGRLKSLQEQQNEKLLKVFEDDGHLQRLIIDMYKKF